MAVAPLDSRSEGRSRAQLRQHDRRLCGVAPRQADDHLHRYRACHRAAHAVQAVLDSRGHAGRLPGGLRPQTRALPRVPRALLPPPRGVHPGLEGARAAGPRARYAVLCGPLRGLGGHPRHRRARVHPRRQAGPAPAPFVTRAGAAVGRRRSPRIPNFASMVHDLSRRRRFTTCWPSPDSTWARAPRWRRRPRSWAPRPSMSIP